MDIKDIKERERKFRERDLPFGIFSARTKTTWSNQIELKSVLGRLKLRGTEDILDIGCSDGRFLECLHARFPGCGCFGMDFAFNPLKHLRDKNFTNYPVCGDMSDMPFKPNSFDHAVAVQVVQQGPTREERHKILRNIFYLLREQGVFVATVINQKTWHDLVENGKAGPLVTAPDIFVYLYNTEDFAQELEEAGFAVEWIAGINNLPGRYLNRLKPLGVWLDLFISRFWRSLSVRKGTYLLASCRKR